VARVQLPALRDRKADIVLIAEHILNLLSRRLGIDVEGFEEEALECLLRYPWPGNVRELRNILEVILIQRRSGRITLADLPEGVREGSQAGGTLLKDELARMLAALTATEWNKSKAAERLHWSRMTLYRKIAKYNLFQFRGM
jgi:two-component system response regulator HydG/two-component system response regulator AtoC